MLLNMFQDTTGIIRFDDNGITVERRAKIWNRTSTYQLDWSAITDVWALREVDERGSTLFLRILAGDRDVTVSDREQGWLELARELPGRVDGFPKLRGWLPRIYQKPSAHAAMPIFQRPGNVIGFRKPKAAAAHA